MLFCGKAVPKPTNPCMSIFERYTENAKKTMHLAKCEADKFGSPEVGADHILLALLHDPAVVNGALEGISAAEIRDEIKSRITQREQNPLPHDLPLAEDARKVLVLATEEAKKLNQGLVRNEHVFLALVQCRNSYAAQLLVQKGLSADRLRVHIRALPPSTHAPSTEVAESPDATELRQTILRVSTLVGQGKGRKALKLLDDYFGEPGQDRKLRMGFLGQFAAIQAKQAGDLKAARRYCEELLSYDPQNPLALYALADCLEQQGEADEARKCASDCRKIALSRGDEIGKGVVELVERRFPELNRQV